MNPVRLTGSSDQVHLIAAVPGAKTLDKGEALVAPGPVGSYLAALPGQETVTVSTTETDLVIDRGDSRPYSFLLLHATYPEVQPSKGSKTSVDLGRLGDAVGAVKRSAGDEGMIQVKSDDNNITLASTDNYRLTQAIIANAGFGEYEAVLPLSAVERVAKIDPKIITFDKKTLTAVSDDVSMTARALADQTFPALDSVLGKAPAHTVTLSKAELVQAGQRLQAVGADSSVAIAIDHDSLSMVLTDSTVGRGQEEVSVQGGPTTTFTVSVNLKFLIDAALSHVEDTLTLGFTSASDIVFLRTRGTMQVTSAVMPVAGATG